MREEASGQSGNAAPEATQPGLPPKRKSWRARVRLPSGEWSDTRERRLKRLREASSQPSPRSLRMEAAHIKCSGAAGRIAGLSESFRQQLATAEILRYIRRAAGGYEVTVARHDEIFEQTVSGFSSQSLERAMLLRDAALARLPARRLHAVPGEVLRTLGLSTPIPGIGHCPKKSHYHVDYKEAGKHRIKAFYYRRVSQADAYAAAVEFAAELFTAAQGGCKVSAGFIEVRDSRMLAVLKEVRTAGAARRLPPAEKV